MVERRRAPPRRWSRWRGIGDHDPCNGWSRCRGMGNQDGVERVIKIAWRTQGETRWW